MALVEVLPAGLAGVRTAVLEAVRAVGPEAVRTDPLEGGVRTGARVTRCEVADDREEEERAAGVERVTVFDIRRTKQARRAC